VNAEQIGLWAGFVLTLMVFSYIIADNFLYRLAVYVFVGLAAGYVTVVTVEGVLLPWFRATLLSGNTGQILIGAIPLLLGLLLLFKLSPRYARLGNLAMAFIVGIGAAVALAGAIVGTLLPLANATSASVRDDVLNGFLIFIGVSSTLLYFQYLARRAPANTIASAADAPTTIATTAVIGRRSLPMRFVGAVGQGFIVVTLGALYAAAILTSLTIFSERIAFLLMRLNGG